METRGMKSLEPLPVPKDNGYGHPTMDSRQDEAPIAPRDEAFEWQPNDGGANGKQNVGGIYIPEGQEKPTPSELQDMIEGREQGSGPMAQAFRKAMSGPGFGSELDAPRGPEPSPQGPMRGINGEEAGMPVGTEVNFDEISRARGPKEAYDAEMAAKYGEKADAIAPQPISADMSGRGVEYPG